MNASGFMAVFAVSGSVAFLSMHAHKRLLSHFFTQLEQFQIDDVGKRKKKKNVKFANAGTAADEEEGLCKTEAAMAGRDDEGWEGMPQNWQVMYRGILQARKLKRGDAIITQY